MALGYARAIYRWLSLGQECTDLKPDAREKPRCHIACEEEDGFHGIADDDFIWKGTPSK